MVIGEAWRVDIPNMADPTGKSLRQNHGYLCREQLHAGFRLSYKFSFQLKQISQQFASRERNMFQRHSITIHDGLLCQTLIFVNTIPQVTIKINQSAQLRKALSSVIFDTNSLAAQCGKYMEISLKKLCRCGSGKAIVARRGAGFVFKSYMKQYRGRQWDIFAFCDGFGC